jgi:transposase
MTKKIKTISYSKEFQRNAVYLAQSPGRTIASVAQELKVPAWKLRNWIKESKENLERSSELSELVRLQKENLRLQQENEILKKAAAYFAKSLQ